MQYRQSEQAHYVGNDVVVLTYVSKSTDGHVYLVEDLYIIVNARANSATHPIASRTLYTMIIFCLSL